MNIISIIGPSRGEKAALTQYLSMYEVLDLPFNIPDLDWIIDTDYLTHMANF